MNYFSTELSLDEAKSLYRKLMQEYHPDHGGDVEVCAEIIRQYEHYCNQKMQKAFYEAGDDRTKDANASSFAEILRAAMNLVNCRIEIIGFWVYAFDSYSDRQALRDLGFWFSASHKAWIYNGEGKRYIKRHHTTDQNRRKYGSTVVQEEGEEKAENQNPVAAR